MLCPKGVKRYLQGSHPDRLVSAQERDPHSPGGFRPIESDLAIRRCAEAIQRIQSEHGNDAIGVLSGASLTTEKTKLRQRPSFPTKPNTTFEGSAMLNRGANIDSFSLREFLLFIFLGSALFGFMRVSVYNHRGISASVYISTGIVAAIAFLLSWSLCRSESSRRYGRVILVNVITIIVLANGYFLIEDSILTQTVLLHTDPIELIHFLICLDLFLLGVFCGGAVFSREMRRDWLVRGLSLPTLMMLLFLNLFVLRETIASV